MMSLYRRRRLGNQIVLGLSLLATGIGLGWLAVILGTLLYKGASGLSLSVFTEMTPPPGSDGGLLNPIVGSLILTTIAVAIGTPIGILAGTYMAEYGRFSRITHVVRFINDILLSAPSIVVGLFVYEIMVAPMGHFSGIAGAVALAILVVPVVVRTTEDMLALVPKELREAASALGMPLAYVIGKVSYRAARAGIVTGILLAVARKLKPDDVRNFYREHYRVGSAIIAVVGDVDADTIKAQVQKEFAGLGGTVTAQPEPATSTVAPGLHANLIDRNVAQATLILGSSGIARSNPDYYKLQVMNYILGGGGFASRLMKVVRSKAGLAYGIGRQLQCR